VVKAPVNVPCVGGPPETRVAVPVAVNVVGLVNT
jgi:hypothetical protein